MVKRTPKMKPEAVAEFLKEVRLLAESSETAVINNRPWANGRVNKTQQYMAETGITSQIVRDTVRELKVRHFSKVMDDYNPHFQDETVWVFGMKKNLVDHVENLYIKLKIREAGSRFLLIMSFHPEKPTGREAKLEFPYQNYQEAEEVCPSDGSTEPQRG